MKEFLVCFANARGKSYYFDNVNDAIKKAELLRKRCVTQVLILQGCLDNGVYRYPIENKILF